MAHVDSKGYAHVRITVTDIGRSKEFYAAVFGWPVAIDNSAAARRPEVATRCIGGRTARRVPALSVVARSPLVRWSGSAAR